MLAMTDTIREAFAIVGINNRDLARLREILQIMVNNEGTQHATSLALISIARLDKLLEVIAVLRKKTPHRDSPLAPVASVAITLQLKWQQRFRAPYFALDEKRMEALKTVGGLHDIVPRDRQRPSSRMWHVEKRTPVPMSDLTVGRYVAP